MHNCVSVVFSSAAVVMPGSQVYINVYSAHGTKARVTEASHSTRVCVCMTYIYIYTHTEVWNAYIVILSLICSCFCIYIYEQYQKL